MGEVAVRALVLLALAGCAYGAPLPNPEPADGGADVHTTPEPSNYSWCDPYIVWGPVSCEGSAVYPGPCPAGAPCVLVPLHGEPERGVCSGVD